MMPYTRCREKSFYYRLFSEMWDRNFHTVIYMLEDIDVKNMVDNYGVPLLHHAVSAGNEEVVKYLIYKGCQIDVLDNCGNTPLMNAVQYEHQEIILLLLDSNADINLCGEGKENPLKMIFHPEYTRFEDPVFEKFFNILKCKFASDSQQIARILVDVKCPLPRAMDFKDVFITEYLLDAGCPIHDYDRKDGTTALHKAVNNADYRNVKLLLERGADISYEDDYDHIPSDYYRAGEEESYEVLMALLQNDKSLNASTSRGYMVARKAFLYGKVEEVEAMLKFNFDLDNNNWGDDKTTLLLCIAENKNPGIMEKLKGRKFNVHARDMYGNTALWGAALYGHASNFEFLLRHGASPNNVNNDGETVFTRAFRYWTSSDCHLDDIMKRVERSIECGANSMHQNRITGETIFNIPLMGKNFPYYKPIISQVTWLEAYGRVIAINIRQMILHDERCRKYYYLCTRKFDKLKATMVNRTISLFKCLMTPRYQILKYLRNDELAGRVEKMIYRERHSNILHIKLLRKRMQDVLRIAKLRKQAALVIMKITGCDNADVIETIVSLLDVQSWKNVCEANVEAIE